MKRLYVTTYRSDERLDGSDLRELAVGFAGAGAASGVIAHDGRLDGGGGLIVHELAEDAGREFAAEAGNGHQAGSFGGTRRPPEPGSARARPNGAPAYYLGRPASLWISVTGPRARRQHA
jgi:hypothetical protein